jgi:hypothetical protein
LIDLFVPRLIIPSKGLPFRLRPFVLQLCIFFCFLLLIPLGCLSQSYFYLLSFSLTGFTFNSSKISSLFLWSKRMYPAVLKNLISIYVNHFLSFFLRFQITLPYKRKRTASALCTFILEDFWKKVNLKVLFRIPSI